MGTVSDEYMTFVEQVKRDAEGRWPRILESLGIHPDFLKKRQGPCPVCGGTDRFSFDNRYGHGDFYCRNEGPGDGIKLLMNCFGWDFNKTIHEVNDVLGGTANLRRFEPIAPKKRESDPSSQISKETCDRLKRVWSKTLRIVHGDPVDTYLRSRGICLDEFPKVLRYHPGLDYYEEYEEGKFVKVGVYPAMVALVQNPVTGKVQALHRTYLAPGGNGKANIISPVSGDTLVTKKAMGSKQGGVVMLFKSADAKISTCEGIETGFGAYLMSQIPIWPALDAGNLGKLVLPTRLNEVVIFSDNDAPDQNGRRAGQQNSLELASRLKAEGRIVKAYLPKREDTDFLDEYLERVQRKGETHGR